MADDINAANPSAAAATANTLAKAEFGNLDEPPSSTVW